MQKYTSLSSAGCCQECGLVQALFRDDQDGFNYCGKCWFAFYGKEPPPSTFVKPGPGALAHEHSPSGLPGNFSGQVRVTSAAKSVGLVPHRCRSFVGMPSRLHDPALPPKRLASTPL